ncbi:MAG: 6-phospho-3-hexuloisomerase, partial [Thermoplasmata archaeon]
GEEKEMNQQQENGRKRSTFMEAKEYILSRVKEILENGDLETINIVVDKILNTRQIFVYGSGRSGIVGKAFAMRLVQMGLRAYFIGETITPIVEHGDLVIIISNKGETYSAIQTANIVRRVGGEVAVLTSNRQSKLALAANHVIELKIEWDTKHKRFAPLGTLFEVSAFIFLDALVAEVMEKKNENEDTMRARHAIMV